LGPALRAEDQGNEWPEASQRSSHKEIDAVESTQALIGWRVARIERLCRGDRQIGVSADLPFPVKWTATDRDSMSGSTEQAVISASCIAFAAAFDLKQKRNQTTCTRWLFGHYLRIVTCSVLLDLDSTLIDSHPGILASCLAALFWTI
jgi:hypothetical protein